MYCSLRLSPAGSLPLPPHFSLRSPAVPMAVQKETDRILTGQNFQFFSAETHRKTAAEWSG